MAKKLIIILEKYFNTNSINDNNISLKSIYETYK